MSDDPQNGAAAATSQGGQSNCHTAAIISSVNQPMFYPNPEAEYQEILQNPDVFLKKLQSFHYSLGSTKFKIPTLGGKSLDLHHLFVEVTSRGGIEKVISERRWKEVTAAFKFPSSITSASFVLRKYYLSLLYHFEQVYYLRKEEPSTSVIGPDLASTAVNGQAGQHSPVVASVINQCAVNQCAGNLEDGSLVTGTIEAKCDYGYLVSVEFGSEKLTGFLYHVPATAQMPNSLSGHAPRRRRRRKLGLRDPSRPKPNKSGYDFIFTEQQVYQQKGQTDKEGYRSEMHDYDASRLS